MDLSKSLEVFDPNKYDERIHVIGCGSVGSAVVEMMARCGLRNFSLWDFDTVESHNIANQMFRQQDIGKKKVDALRDIILDINPEAEHCIELHYEGWNGENLSGFVILAVDSIEIRRKIAEQHMYNKFVLAMFDFRTGLFDAQHFACDWSDRQQRKNFIDSMSFTDDEAHESNPVSACGVTLGLCTVVRTICSLGVQNFMQFWNGEHMNNTTIVEMKQPMVHGF